MATSPTPWTADKYGFINDAQGGHVCQFWDKFDEDFDNRADNMALVVACVNTLTPAVREQLLEAIQRGPAPVIGYDRDGASQKAFNHGWNAAKEAIYRVARDLGLLPQAEEEPRANEADFAAANIDAALWFQCDSANLYEIASYHRDEGDDIRAVAMQCYAKESARTARQALGIEEIR